jgi:hypothetical protein
VQVGSDILGLMFEVAAPSGVQQQTSWAWHDAQPGVAAVGQQHRVNVLVRLGEVAEGLPVDDHVTGEVGNQRHRDPCARPIAVQPAPRGLLERYGSTGLAGLAGEPRPISRGKLCLGHVDGRTVDPPWPPESAVDRNAVGETRTARNRDDVTADAGPARVRDRQDLELGIRMNVVTDQI